ncbi:Prostaglandin G/H synthase 2 [Frankliniella fusca]|uniref:Prostaglandin G/H synthase 2 n=1 Tax=Frankliniella fusca TaxID=407009 RepID=A0AAE1GPV0_9NEOP|nr:Prostaglandin G/H synthase 2 [Frankliniella fusca]
MSHEGVCDAFAIRVAAVQHERGPRKPKHPLVQLGHQVVHQVGHQGPPGHKDMLHPAHLPAHLQVGS